MRIAVLCGDRWHPAEVVRSGLDGLGMEGVQFDCITDQSSWSPESMERYDAVAIAKSNRMSPEDATPWLTERMQQAFVRYAEGGGTLMLLHAGTVGYAKEPVFLRLAGGVFTGHPAPCPVTLHLAGGEFPAAPGPIVLFDEHYFVDMADEEADVFMTSESEHGVQPAGWTRKQGEGRVVALTPGHYDDVWRHPAYAALLRAVFDRLTRRND